MAEQAGIYGVEELAELASVSRRTVRYYVQRGLLPAPTGVGRGKHYTEQHLQTLIEIRDRQAAGVTLEHMLAPPPAQRATSPRQSAWTRVTLAEGVELHLRGRRLSDTQLERLTREITRVIEREEP